MNLFDEYEQAKINLDQAKAKLDDLQAQVYTLFIDEIDTIDYGKTFSTESNGFKVSIVKKETIAVDQQLADVLGFCFKKKYSLDKTAYNKLTNDDRRRVDECLTSKPAKPTFKVERL